MNLTFDMEKMRARRDMTASLVMWGRQRWGKKTMNAKTCRLFLQICKKYIIVDAIACWDEINQLV